MKKREAEEVLERAFGTREHLVRCWCRPMPARVARAIKALGGEYRPGWGLTRVPPLWKLGRI